jgi:hypothetical protein
MKRINLRSRRNNDTMYQSHVCAYCGYSNRRGVLFCEECANPLVGSADETIKGDEMAQLVKHALRQLETGETERFEQETLLLLHIRDQAEPLEVFIGAKRLTIGRFDSRTNRKVDVDLTPYGALPRGVSRLHAVLFRSEDDTLYITDINSANGTYLNGHRLAPHEPIAVNNGDEVSLGKMRMHVYFEKPKPAVTSTRS